MLCNILSIEQMLILNKVSTIDNMTSVGQIIALIIGVGGFMQTCYVALKTLLVSHNSPLHQRRRLEITMKPATYRPNVALTTHPQMKRQTQPSQTKTWGCTLPWKWKNTQLDATAA